MPATGTYRRLFVKGLEALIEGGTLSDSDEADAKAYLTMLADPSYKFGQFHHGGGQQRWGPGELFLRS